jgi:Fe-S-cluster-containing hydrogenase component 2
MGKVLVVDGDKCIGCRVCELVCSFVHYKEYNPKISFIRVLKNEEMGIYIPVLDVRCDLCGGEEKCVKYCPSDALEFVDTKKAALIRKESKMGRFPAVFIGIQ